MDREQLYNTLCDIINDHSLSEVGILPSLPDEAERSTNSYYPFIFVENNLGIPLPIVHHIIAYSSSEFMKYRQQKDQELDKLELSSRVLFMVSPDHYTAANARKFLIQSNVVDAEKELVLIDLMFTIPKHSKSSIAWHHRKWIQNYLMNERGQMLNVAREVQLCERTATLYPKNYYSWTYRHWLLTHMSTLDEKINEYQWSLKWVESHISDHAGIQHLERCLYLLHQTQMIKAHLTWIRGHIKRYPGHESLWCHMRYCTNLAISKRISHKRIFDYTTEPTFIDDVLKACKASDSGDEDMQKQWQLALRYGLWITHLINHTGWGNEDLTRWAIFAMAMYTKELEKLADQSTFYKMFEGWTCHNARIRRSTTSNYYRRLPNEDDNAA
ncbi:hypothetical protein BGW37DRAFT_518001 [Umbelopsis sp. PMI_123]|nr:hypothetical protein BGW37DRAFT_518001 [Umbelopsis sp. PMI_123]